MKYNPAQLLAHTPLAHGEDKFIRCWLEPSFKTIGSCSGCSAFLPSMVAVPVCTPAMQYGTTAETRFHFIVTVGVVAIEIILVVGVVVIGIVIIVIS